MRSNVRSGIVTIILFAGLFLGPSVTCAAGSPMQDRAKCDAISEKEARDILDALQLNEARVLKIRTSPVQGLWELAIENHGQRFLVYVDCSKKYVMPGPIIERHTGADKTRQRVEELNREKRVSLADLRLDEALVMGDRSAPVKVIVFLDPD